jgi:hypothetical protein
MLDFAAARVGCLRQRSARNLNGGLTTAQRRLNDGSTTAQRRLNEATLDGAPRAAALRRFAVRRKPAGKLRAAHEKSQIKKNPAEAGFQ